MAPAPRWRETRNHCHALSQAHVHAVEATPAARQYGLYRSRATRETRRRHLIGKIILDFVLHIVSMGARLGAIGDLPVTARVLQSHQHFGAGCEVGVYSSDLTRARRSYDASDGDVFAVPTRPCLAE